MSSRISAGIKSIFSVAPSLIKRSTDTERDAQGKQEQAPREERQPTEEEARRALEILLRMDSITKNGLCAELEFVEGVYTIHVRDQKGASLRVLRGHELLRLLDAGTSENPGSSQRGRILDRRI